MIMSVKGFIPMMDNVRTGAGHSYQSRYHRVGRIEELEEEHKRFMNFVKTYQKQTVLNTENTANIPVMPFHNVYDSREDCFKRPLSPTTTDQNSNFVAPEKLWKGQSVVSSPLHVEPAIFQRPTTGEQVPHNTKHMTSTSTYLSDMNASRFHETKVMHKKCVSTQTTVPYPPVFHTSNKRLDRLFRLFYGENDRTVRK